MSMSIQASTPAAQQVQEPTRMPRHREHAGPGNADKADAQRPQVRPALAEAVSGALSQLMPDAEAAATTQRGDGTKALQQFTHELFRALRPTAGDDGPGRQGRGFAWGRTSLGDIAQRLDTLAQQIGGAASAASTAAAAPPAGSTDAAVAAGDALAAAVAPPAAELPVEAPAEASPPASPLLSAFQALTQQLGGDTGASEGASALATLLTRIAQALQADPAVMAPAAGSLVDVTA